MAEKDTDYVTLSWLESKNLTVNNPTENGKKRYSNNSFVNEEDVSGGGQTTKPDPEPEKPTEPSISPGRINFTGKGTYTWIVNRTYTGIFPNDTLCERVCKKDEQITISINWLDINNKTGNLPTIHVHENSAIVMPTDYVVGATSYEFNIKTTTEDLNVDIDFNLEY